MAASIKGVQGKTSPKAPLQAESGEPGVQCPNWRAANSSPMILPKSSGLRWRMARGHGRQTAPKTISPNTTCHHLLTTKCPNPKASSKASTPALKKRKPTGPLVRKERPNQNAEKRILGSAGGDFL